MSKHHCHARGCKTACKPEMLMCLPHWRLVPKNLQKRVWATYRPGQCDDKRPSESWHKAADAAIEAVWKTEREYESMTLQAEQEEDDELEAAGEHPRSRQSLFEDGVTHINCYSKGKTLLGRTLSNFAESPFELPDHGKFQSVEGFWFWMATKDDKLRTLSGLEAKTYGRLIRMGSKPGVDFALLSLETKLDFQFQIKRAILAKIAQRPALEDMIRDSTLPFKHYYVDGDGRPVFLQSYEWMMDWLQEIRDALKDSPKNPLQFSKM